MSPANSNVIPTDYGFIIRAMSSACTVFVRIKPLKGHYEACKVLLLEALPEVRRLKGCEEYVLFDETQGDLIIYERWSSREDWQSHFESQAIQTLKAQLTLKVELPVERLETYSAEK